MFFKDFAFTKAFGHGFDIIAFPCNQFGKQESGPLDVIKEDMNKFGINFTFMDKVDVNGRKISPIYRFLKEQPGCNGGNFRTKCASPSSFTFLLVHPLFPLRSLSLLLLPCFRCSPTNLAACSLQNPHAEDILSAVWGVFFPA